MVVIPILRVLRRTGATAVENSAMNIFYIIGVVVVVLLVLSFLGLR
ncbi:MAG TPA: hypothetical protein VEB20_26210 [Azospirillaceae bacterium]|nr:hypothetical protein [Azospirillaceae bacterium]